MELDISQAIHLTDSTAEAISTCIQLVSLSIEGCQFSEKGIETIIRYFLPLAFSLFSFVFLFLFISFLFINEDRNKKKREKEQESKERKDKSVRFFFKFLFSLYSLTCVNLFLCRFFLFSFLLCFFFFCWHCSFFFLWN